MNAPRPLLPLALAMIGLSGCATPGMELGPSTAWVKPANTIRHGVDAETLYRTGRYLQGMDRLAQAAQAYREVLAQQPAHVDALNALGVLYAMQGEDAKAEQSFRVALSHAPAAAHVMNNLGYLLVRTGRLDEALQFYEQGQASEPLNAVLAANITQLRARLAPAQAATVALPSTASSAPNEADAVVQAFAVPVAPQAVRVESVDAATAPADEARLEQVGEQVWALRAPLALPGMRARAETVAAPASSAPAVEVFPRRVAVAVAADALPVVALQRVEIANGNGRTGLAGWVASLLGAQPQAKPRLTNDPPYAVAHSRIEYLAGAEQLAHDVNAGLPVALPLQRVHALARDLRVRVLLGHDFPVPNDPRAPLKLASAGAPS